jgi:methylamine---glutamate N-methyltransferase subunit C
MTEEERGHSKTLVYQYLPSRYGMNPDDLRRADAIEVVVGQGAKPGGGGMLLGQKISDRVAMMRNLPKGIDQRSACRHPTGPGRMILKSRSSNCAKSPIGKSRSTSRSAARAPITTPRWP